MSDGTPAVEGRSNGRFILASLVSSRFATQPPAILTGLLLIDIGETFGCSVGVMGQMRTLSAIVTFIFALLMGALSVRFSHKSLLTTGLSFFCVSALVCSIAQSYASMLVAYSLSGLGLGMVAPMVTTLVAAYFPLERRARAIGLIMAGAALSAVVGAPIIGFIAGLWGWRITFIGFVLPISLLSLLLAMKILPSAVGGQQVGMSGGRYFTGFKAVFANGSAIACLVAEMLRVSGFIVFYIYSASFLRQRFLMSTGFTSLFFPLTALCYTLGSFVSGRLVASFGRKPVTVAAILLSGVSTISFILSPSLWLALMLNLIGCLFAGINSSAAQSLNLEQVPEFRGAMMSMSTAAMNLGEAIGAGMGGLALLLFGYEALGVSLGAMAIAAAMIYHLLTTDPTRF